MFECSWVHYGSEMFFWNYQLGYGFAVDKDWEVMCGFFKMMDEFTNEFDSEDFEPAHYPWQVP